MDKRCTTCGLSKDTSKFGKRKSKNWKGLNSKCKSCDAKYHLKWYWKNHEKRLSQERISRANRRIKYKEIRKKAKDVPCRDCGIKYPYYVMQFDHLHDKNFTIGEHSLIAENRLLEEIAKCEVVCANCHSIRTHRRGRESEK